jgi:hypothetical protein
MRQTEKTHSFFSQVAQKIPAPLRHARAVSLIALLILLLFWAVMPFREFGGFADYAAFYRPVADNLQAGKGYKQSDENLATRYPPGHPLLLVTIDQLAAVTRLPRAALLALLYAACFCFSARLFYEIAACWWEPISAFLCTAGWMTYPPLLFLTTQPFTETPYLLLFLGGLLLFWHGVTRLKMSYLMLTGLSLGAAALIRPMGAYVGLALIFCLLALRKKFGQSWKNALAAGALLLAGQLAMWLPWQGFVYAKTGEIFFLSTAFVPAMRDGLRFGVNLKGYRQTSALPPDVINLMERINARFDEMNNGRQVIKVVNETSREYRLSLIKLYVIKMARAWYGTDSASRETPLLLLQLFYLSAFSIGAWMAYRQGSLDLRYASIVVILLLGSWGITTLALSILRYMTPVIGLLFLFLPGLWQGKAAAPAING